MVKEYGGALARSRGRAVRALDGISLRLEPGAAVGIAGPNGAGKSTLLRLLLGYLRPSAGVVAIGGMEPRAYVERFGIGYVSELIAIPPGWTVSEAMRTFASLAEVQGERGRIAEVLEQLGIDALADRRVGDLSKGNLQRVALAQALLAPRKVMILDEPSHGLDPEWTAGIRELVAAWRAEDPERVLLLASHNLEEMERSVQQVAVLRDGRLCAMIDALAPPALHLAVEASGAARLQDAMTGAIAIPGHRGGFRMDRFDLREVSARLAPLLAGGVVLEKLAVEREPLAERVRRVLLQAGEA